MLGYGFGKLLDRRQAAIFTEISDVHNGYLDILLELGAVGTVLPASVGSCLVRGNSRMCWLGTTTGPAWRFVI